MPTKLRRHPSPPRPRTPVSPSLSLSPLSAHLSRCGSKPLECAPCQLVQEKKLFVASCAVRAPCCCCFSRVWNAECREMQFLSFLCVFFGFWGLRGTCVLVRSLSPTKLDEKQTLDCLMYPDVPNRCFSARDGTVRNQLEHVCGVCS